MLLKDQLKGILMLGPKMSEKGFSGEDVELLKTIVNQATVGIENSELYDATLEMKRYYDDIIQSMTSGMLTVDRQLRIVTLNRAGEEILEMQSDNVRGREITEVFRGNADFAGAVVETSVSSAVRGSLREIELDVDHGPGKTLAMVTSALRNQKSEDMGVVALFSDITKEKELQKQLERSKQLAYMGQLAADIAHEIKNPIGSIRLFVDALARDFTDPVTQKNFKEVIPQEVENIDKMVRGLLFLARPSSLNRVDLDLSEIVRITCQFCNEDAVFKGTNLDMHLPERPVRILADGEKLKQALRNIILNAIEAVPSCDGRVIVFLLEEGNSVQIGVRDNGSEIPEDISARLFNPFFTTKSGGTGLGLAIASRIVEDHGGCIKVVSSAVKGTTFTIDLPKNLPED
jgi:two-component system sensor histidine kinase HydH